MEIPAAITAQMALVRQNAAMSMVKSSAEADKAVANMLAELVESAPTGGRGGIVNITA